MKVPHTMIGRTMLRNPWTTSPSGLRGALLAFAMLSTMLSSIFSTTPASGQAKPGGAAPTEADYYRIVTLPTPPGAVLEAGAIERLPDGRIAVSTRRGEIWLVANSTGKPEDAQFQRFAEGLHEVLGLAWRDGWLYVTQRCEVSRLKDVDGDSQADLFETVCDAWEINGDYHEYAFGSKFDAEGNLWVVLCLTGSFNSDVKFRGWCLRVGADGKMTPTCSGIRSPGGIGSNAAGDFWFFWESCGSRRIVAGGFRPCKSMSFTSKSWGSNRPGRSRMCVWIERRRSCM